MEKNLNIQKFKYITNLYKNIIFNYDNKVYIKPKGYD
jgi:hypothetical protein